MADFGLLVLGDSILWGQGLAEGHKISERVAARFRTPARDVRRTRFAHSGACVWDANHTGWLDALDPTPPPLPPAPVGITEDQIRAVARLPDPSPAARDLTGEIPAQAPFTLAQAVAAKDALG